MTHSVEQSGYNHVQIAGDAGNDLIDVCRLTCLEQGIKVISLGESGNPRITNSTNSINSANRRSRVILRMAGESG